MTTATLLLAGCTEGDPFMPASDDATPPRVTLSMSADDGSPAHVQVDAETGLPWGAVSVDLDDSLSFLAEGTDEEGGVPRLTLTYETHGVCGDAAGGRTPLPPEQGTVPFQDAGAPATVHPTLRGGHVIHLSQLAAKCPAGTQLVTAYGDVLATATNAGDMSATTQKLTWGFWEPK